MKFESKIISYYLLLISMAVFVLSCRSLDIYRDIASPDSPSMDKLLNVVEKNDLEGVRKIINNISTGDLKAVDTNGRNSLMLAAFNGNAPIANEILDIVQSKNFYFKRSYISLKNNNGATALNLAVPGSNDSAYTANITNRLEVVKLLLAAKYVNVNAQNNYGQTALMSAPWTGSTDIVLSLLAKENIDTNLANFQGLTALMLASWGGHLEIVKALLDKGADISIKSTQATTAINFASDPDVHKLLLLHYRGEKKQ